MHEHRDASSQLTFAFEKVSMGKYPKIVRKVIREFDLVACGEKTVGLEEVFQDFGRDSVTVGLEWDHWSGFMVCAKNQESEALARQVADYVLNL